MLGYYTDVFMLRGKSEKILNSTDLHLEVAKMFFNAILHDVAEMRKTHFCQQTFIFMFYIFYIIFYTFKMVYFNV